MLTLRDYQNENDSEGNKKAIIEFIKEHNKRPSEYSKDAEEKRLGKLLASYIVPYSGQFDAAFRAEIETLVPFRRNQPK